MRMGDSSTSVTAVASYLYSPNQRSPEVPGSAISQVLQGLQEKHMAVENQELRKAGLKVTLPRVKILQMLEATDEAGQHMSAENVYLALRNAGEDVGLATVYRVLTQFETAGLVVRHNFATGHSVFELAKGDHHDHMVCMD